MNDELDPAQKLAEEARQAAANRIKSQEQTLHNLASNMVKNFKEPEYKPGELAIEQHKRKEANVVPEKKANSNIGAFLDLGKHKIAVTGVPVIDIAAVLTYIFTTVLADDPRIDAILRKAKIQLQDIYGNLIYPPKRKRKKSENQSE